MTSTWMRNVVVLGTITALGPFAIDMYLPAFAAIANDLHTDQGAVQQSLVSFFAALAIGQTIYGPVSDQIGRRLPLLAGLLLFVAASAGCALAPNIGTLIVLRFVQGLGGCAGMVMSRAIIRDLHSGEEAARLFALTLLILGVSPVFAPLIGSSIVAFGSWRLIFVLVGLIAIAAIVMVATMLPETRVATARPEARSAFSHVLGTSARLLSDVPFVSAVLAAGFAQASLFAYLAGSSFVFISVFGTSPFTFSAIFAVNAVALIGGAQFTAPLIRRFGAVRLISLAVAAFTALAIGLALLTFYGAANLAITTVLVFLQFGCMGFIMPPATMLALEPHGEAAGTASSLMGTIQFALGAVAGFLVGSFFDGSARPLMGTMALAAVAALLSWLVYLAVRHRGVPAVAIASALQPR